MAEGFPCELARVPLTKPGDSLDVVALVDWPDVQRVLTAWMVKGCAAVVKGGATLDLVSVGAVTPEGLLGAELVIYCEHVRRQFPWLVRRS